MFDRDVARCVDKFLSRIQETEAWLRERSYNRALFNTKLLARNRVLCESCFFYHLKRDRNGRCLWRHRFTNEDCALFYARLLVERLWDYNGRGSR